MRMNPKIMYVAPAVRIAPVRTEPFCLSGGVPDYDPVEGFEWGED